MSIASSSTIAQTNSLRTQIQLSLLKNVKDTQAAEFSTMLHDFTKTQTQIAQHPYLGQSLDMRA